MTENEWIAYAMEHRSDLATLLRRYHPVQRDPQSRPQEFVSDLLPITAPTAEAACENIREDIRRNFEGDPVTHFEEALQRRDVGTILGLLNQAWFGVPESTSCWRIPGFREAVNLMDDPPEEES
jgi:hypothetical protein